MGKVILYIATTMDHFIASENGGVDFLDKYQDVNYGFDQFFDDIDICVMGAKTFLQVMSFEMKWPYVGKKTIVYSSRKLAAPDAAHVHFRNCIDWAEIDMLRANKNIWIVGGVSIASQFLERKKIDVIEIFEMPTRLTTGRKLKFAKKNFRITKEKVFENGVIYKEYQRVK